MIYMTEIADFDLTKPKCDPKLLLDAGPPRALYKVNPRLIFGKVWWDEVRKWAYKKSDNKCAACGKSDVKLEAHELYNIDTVRGRMELKDVVALCWKCHSFIHQDLHRGLISQGVMKASDVARVIDHGKRVLARYNIKCIRKDPNVINIKPEDWRLVVQGREYEPIPKGE